MNKTLKSFHFLFLLFSGLIAYSQIKDAGLWQSFNLCGK